MVRRPLLFLSAALAIGLGFARGGAAGAWSSGFVSQAAAQQVTLQPAAAPAAFAGGVTTGNTVDPAASLVTPVPDATAPTTSPSAPTAAQTQAPNLTAIPGLTTATPVVLELFTAEGCASCLPAEANVGQWAVRRSVLVLAYHVDYWDYIGWRDSKADPAFVQRQLGYVTAFGGNMVYTPQLVVAGSAESLGTDHDRLATALADSAPVARMSPLRLVRDQEGRVLLDLPTASLAKPATLWLMTYRRQTETDILAGENAGKHLAAVNVVRSIQKLGQWSGLAGQLALPLNLQAGGAIPADAAAVIANQGDYGPIIGATAVAFDSLR
ncbi:MAG TPA: DUF1223 domain-containing protein [Dongiaceae bacterium]